jgi:hypothetical protein
MIRSITMRIDKELANSIKDFARKNQIKNVEASRELNRILRLNKFKKRKIIRELEF